MCGLGSIGQRHVRLLRRLLGAEAELACVRRRGLSLAIHDDLTATSVPDLAEYYGLLQFPDLESAEDWDPDVVFVTNPIAAHVATATWAVKNGAAVFVEKPLGSDLEGTDSLVSLIDEAGIPTMVGYQLRFHPLFRRVKEWLDAGEIGRPLAAQVFYGEWLPGMHPYEDYRESHAARRDQGGGTILCLSHEIDLVRWLLGDATTVAAAGGKLSDLELDVEDVSDLLFAIDHDGPVVASVHLDFVANPPRRWGSIVGETGVIEWDLLAARLTRSSPSAPEPHLESFRHVERNEVFAAELQDFLGAIRSGVDTSLPVAEGLATLRTCIAARRALASGTVEPVR